MVRIEKYYPVVLIILFFLVHLLLFSHYGIRNLYDATVYLQEADFLLQHARLEDSQHVFYIIPIALIAFFRCFLPEQIIAYLIFQCIVSCLAMLSLYSSSVRIFNSRLAGLITGCIFLFWWDTIHWNTTTMTESLACSTTCFVIYFLTFFRNTVKEYSIIGILLIIVFFIRPTGIIIIVASFSFMLRYHWEKLSFRPVLRSLIIVCVLLMGCIGAMMMFSLWDFTDQLKRGNIITYMDTIEGRNWYEKSMHVDVSHIEMGNEDQHPLQKLASYIFNNPLHFLKTAFLKVWYLLSFYRPYYTAFHNFYSLVWVSLVYILYTIGIRKANDTIKIFTLMAIIINCLLISVATVDWDNRFFIPMEPGLVLLAGGGGMYALEWVRSQMKLKSKMKSLKV